MSYESVKREDIDFSKTYCIWITDNDFDEIHKEDLIHYRETGELYHNGYEVGGEFKKSIFLQPIYKECTAELIDYKAMCESLEKERDELKVECKDRADCEKSLTSMFLAAEKEVAELKELAINFITHSEDVRQIQYKCFADEYPSVKDAGMAIPTYQTMALQKKLKKISRVTDADLCSNAIKILMKDIEGGEG